MFFTKSYLNVFISIKKLYYFQKNDFLDILVITDTLLNH